MRWIEAVAVLFLGAVAFSLGYATRPEVQSEPRALKVDCPAPAQYALLDRLMSEALDGYARGNLQTVRQMEMVLSHLMEDAEKQSLATVAGLRPTILQRLADKCEESEDPHSEQCLASLKAERFFDEVDVAVRGIGWEPDRTYTIAEYASRARRAMALYEWQINP